MGTVVWRNPGYDRDGSHDARDYDRRRRRRDKDGDEGYSRHTIQRKIENMKEEEDGARTERKRESDSRREDHRIGRKRDRSGVQENGPTDMDGVQTRARVERASPLSVIINCVKPLKEKEEILRTKPKMDKGGVIRSERLVEGAIGERAAEKPIEQAAGRSGGVYVPPFKLAQLMRDVKDKSSPNYQRMTWDALRKSINGSINKVNAGNIPNILGELFGENLMRGRGLFARSCMKAQMASPTFTHVFAAVVACVNTKFPELGELLLKRIILQLWRAFKRNDKPVLLAAAKFIAHLVNQQVAHEILALELLTILLDKPTDDSVEVAVGFVKECGAILQDLSPQGLHGIFERFRGILHEGEIDKRVQFMIEGLFAIRKTRFQGFPAVTPELDLVEQEDQITHELSLEDELDQKTGLGTFYTPLNSL